MKKLFILLSLIVNTVAYADFLPQSFEAKFEQEYISTLKSKVKKGEGEIAYKYPGQIRFETNTPSTVIYVSNSKKSWYYRAPFVPGEEGEVTVTSAASGATPYTKFFDVLKNGLVNNKFYDVKKDQDTTLIFTADANKEFGIKEANLIFTKKDSTKFEDLERIELTFSDGKTSKIKFKELKINSITGADRFNFIPPANTKVVN